MTVGELRNTIKNMDDKTEIVVGDNSGANDDYILRIKDAYQLKNGELRIEVRGLANVIENTKDLLNV